MENEIHLTNTFKALKKHKEKWNTFIYDYVTPTHHICCAKIRFYFTKEWVSCMNKNKQDNSSKVEITFSRRNSFSSKTEALLFLDPGHDPGYKLDPNFLALEYGFSCLVNMGPLLRILARKQVIYNHWIYFSFSLLVFCSVVIGCATPVLVPAKVIHALNLNIDELNAAGQPRFSSAFGVDYG